MQGEITLNADTLPEIRNLVEEYPYFQAAQILYTLNLRTTKDSRFDAELRKTACYAADRKNLFYRVENDYFVPEKIEKLEKHEETVPGSAFELIDSFLSRKNTKESIRPETVATDYVSYLFSEDKKDAKTGTVALQHQDTIDKFLEANEKTPVKIVLKDEMEANAENPFPDLDQVNSESFFSETLAKIYLKQKKYGKALEIIRKLNLIYPEKNRYFADQIRFLEKLIINTKK